VEQELPPLSQEPPQLSQGLQGLPSLQVDLQHMRHL
jgi:hypothetical protein